jgi:hypothetical protein
MYLNVAVFSYFRIFQIFEGRYVRRGGTLMINVALAYKLLPQQILCSEIHNDVDKSKISL